MKKKFILLILVIILSISIVSSGIQVENGNLNIINTDTQDNIEKDVLNKTELHFLDVGQGDSTLVILPNGETMLIDAGKSNYGDNVVNYIKNKNISKIDHLVMTHPDADHIGGMSKVIDNFDIGKIYMTDSISTTRTFEDLLLNIDSKDLNITILKANDIISEFDDFKAILLSPVKKYDDNNEMSLVIQITYGNNTFLLMGDAGIKAENDILNSNSNIKADLIKIGHHGSSSSSGAIFIEKVSPQFAIISCGKDNQYGHPTSKTIETLNQNKVKIYRTDNLGDIIAISDGNVINIDNNG
jgi:beta-lactamase superfamily II metal-dependent hydrolase